MRIFDARETDLVEEMRSLSRRLGHRQGATGSGGDERARALFGQSLPPIEVVRRILDDVRDRGDDALADYALRLDGVDLAAVGLRVAAKEISAAWDATPASLRQAMERAAENIRRCQQAILPVPAGPITNAHGGMVEIRTQPLRRVGLYVPGGRAAYPSTLLMTAIPAQVAGVDEVAVATPCGPDGRVRQETLAAAHLCGIQEIYRIGGAQAIAAFAFGTRSIRRVDKIVGPGNLYVTLAKREVYGDVALDMLAGPSEILIIADSSAEPRFIAADMLGQAEHDPAAAILLTPERTVAEATLAQIEMQIPALSRGRAARDCLERYGFVGVVRDLDQAVALADEFAPEHLELAVANAEALLPAVRNAGAIFIGQETPESLGDYVAGPSHVLPTGGTARFFSGLSVHDFLRRTSIIRYNRGALARAARDVDALARAEGLDAHARAVAIRFETT